MARRITPRRAGGRKPERPQRFQVVLLFDLQTSVEMVLRVLRAVFNKAPEEALRLMFAARKTGATAIAITTHEVAETKAKMATDFASRERQPVTLRIEPAR